MFIFTLLDSYNGLLLQQTADIDDVASDLASVISTQKTLVEECGNLLSEAHRLQVSLVSPKMVLTSIL